MPRQQSLIAIPKQATILFFVARSIHCVELAWLVILSCFLFPLCHFLSLFQIHINHYRKSTELFAENTLIESNPTRNLQEKQKTPFHFIQNIRFFFILSIAM